MLKFSNNKGRAKEFMEGHNAWIRRGFDDGVFLLVGNLEPKLGGGIVAHDLSLAEIQGRVNDDPFVTNDVVSAKIIEIAPSRADERLYAGDCISRDRLPWFPAVAGKSAAMASLVNAVAGKSQNSTISLVPCI